MENAEGPNYGEESALREASDGDMRLFAVQKAKGTRPSPLCGKRSDRVARQDQKTRDFGGVVDVEFAVGAPAVDLHGLF